MSVSSEVRRTLVKSPPELWAELSDPLALARHLDELGEIRITGTIPERIVDWEAASERGADTIGRIEIEPSGWGTRVTLSASRQTQSSRPDAETTPEPAAEAAPEPAPTSQPETAPESSPVFETEIVASEPLKAFWTRLFRRRRATPQPERSIEPQAPIEADTPVQPEPDATAGEPSLVSEQPAAPPPHPTSAPDIAAELAELEQQTTAVLTGVLDRLGAAHHRPFSRA